VCFDCVCYEKLLLNVAPLETPHATSVHLDNVVINIGLHPFSAVLKVLKALKVLKETREKSNDLFLLNFEYCSAHWFAGKV
jgi:hypothetical protein